MLFKICYSFWMVNGLVLLGVCLWDAMGTWMVSSWFPSFFVFIPAFLWPLFHTLTPVPP